MDNIAFLELKYGNIYGGYPNYFVISDISLLVFEPDSKKIFLESMSINADVDVVFVNTKVDELGHTVGRLKYVANLRTRRKQRFLEEHKLDERDLDEAFKKSRDVKRHVKGFLMKNFRKYRVRDIVTFDGRRDIFLCERSGVDFGRIAIHDIQRDLNKECNYLFSLNKLAVIIGFGNDNSNLKSNNISYFLHPIAGRQVKPKSAAYDAARLLMIHQEYREHKDDFLMKAALLLNKIQVKQKEKEEREAAIKAANPDPEPVVEEKTATEEAKVTTEEVTTTEEAKVTTEAEAPVKETDAPEE